MWKIGNACIKGNFEVKGTPVEKMEKHGNLFRACAILVKQMAMQMSIGQLYEI